MDSKRKLGVDELIEMKTKFQRALSLLYRKILDGQQLPKLSKATIEAILVGIYSNVDSLEQEDNAALLQRYNQLRNDDNFSLESLSEGLSATDKVKSRISTGIRIFS